MRAAPWLVLAAALAGCPSRPPIGPQETEDKRAGRTGGAPCAGLAEGECGRAKGLLAAASGFGNVKHEYLLDPASAIAPGRGVQRGPEGAYSVLPTRCAQERGAGAAAAAPKVDATTIDFSYVGVAIDQALVSADADLTPWLSAGGEAAEHKISLVALAFVRDLDPQFFSASEDVAFGGEGCTCGRATHFVGAVKMGGLLAYEMRVRSGELHGRALEFVRARIAAGDARVTQTVVGGLEVSGIEKLAPSAASSSGPPPALSFAVKNPVPIAYAIYPLADVCKFAFPAPDVAPEVLDFGDVPYESESTKLLHIVNRAPIDLRASVGERTFAVPALGSADVPVTWRPNGAAIGCEVQTRDETLQFYPRDADAPVVPKMQTTRIVERVRTGKPTYRRHEHVDTGVSRKPDYAGTKREWTCPDDYAVSSCRTEKAECGDGRCATDGYAVNAEPVPNGCRFGCKGPEGLIPGLSSNFCRFDAVMECRLRCR
jgi:hypothetical protein